MIRTKQAEPAGGRKRTKQNTQQRKMEVLFSTALSHLCHLKHSFRSSGCLQPATPPPAPSSPHTRTHTQCVSFSHGTGRCTLCIVEIEPVIQLHTTKQHQVSLAADAARQRAPPGPVTSSRAATARPAHPPMKYYY